MRKALKDMKFPEWFVQYGSERKGFKVYEILRASSKDGADVGLIIHGAFLSFVQKALKKDEKHLSYNKFRKLEDVKNIHPDAKKRIIHGIFNTDSKKIK